MNENKSVLIAGASGYVGKALVNHLLSKGFKVNVLTRDVEKTKAILPKQVGVFKWPQGNEKIMLTNCGVCHAVINLAGSNIGAKRWTISYKQQILSSRVNSIVQLNAIVKQMNQTPKVWIQASAIGFYGSQHVQDADELAPLGEGFLAKVVQTMELQLNKVNLHGTRKVVLRFGIVISKEGGFLKQMKQLFNLGFGVIPGNGVQHISWIHLDDLTRLITDSLENENYEGVINAVSPKPIQFNDFAYLLKLYTRALAVFTIPAFIFSALLGKEKTNEMMLADQIIIPKRLMGLGFSYNYSEFESVFN